MTDESDVVARLGWYPVRAGTRRNPSSDDLDRLEARLGGILPDDYRQFVTRYGQGAPRDRKWFPIEGSSPWGPWGILDQFLGFSSNPHEGIEGAAFELFADEIPPRTLPIAYDPGGNLLLLAATGAALPTGSVWFWDHEHRPRGPEPDGPWQTEPGETDGMDTNLYAVAPSFRAFLESLRENKG